jgi:hypothetical protein
VKHTLCQGCGRYRAGGGQRFCWECLGTILSHRRPTPPCPTAPFRYPLPRKRQRTSSKTP